MLEFKQAEELQVTDSELDSLNNSISLATDSALHHSLNALNLELLVDECTLNGELTTESFCSNSYDERSHLVEVRRQLAEAASSMESEFLAQAAETYGTGKFFEILEQNGLALNARSAVQNGADPIRPITGYYVGNENELFPDTPHQLRVNVLEPGAETDRLGEGPTVQTDIGPITYANIYQGGVNLQKWQEFFNPESEYFPKTVEEINLGTAYNEAWHQYWRYKGFNHTASELNLNELALFKIDGLDPELTADYIDSFGSDAASLSVQPSEIANLFNLAAKVAVDKESILTPSYLFTGEFMISAITEELGISRNEFQALLTSQSESQTLPSSTKQLFRLLSDDQLKALASKVEEQQAIFWDALLNAR